jgi:DNA-binding response OmpR family regulator
MTQVLVVDDDDDIRLLVAELLRLTGYEVVAASSGVQALELLAAGTRPDLVLLDVQMPELDGWDTLRTIRGTEAVADLPVVLCTVKSGPVDTALGWSLGCDGYVVKPFAIDALVEEVEGVLGRSVEERRRLRTERSIDLGDLCR